jgi:hypothetical protein
MSNFETDNQDKSNLVGDAKVMSDAVDREQELIRLKDDLRAKAKAWDDLEALMSSDKGPLLIGYSEYNGQSLVKYNGVFYGCNTITEGVSNALESIRGES